MVTYRNERSLNVRPRSPDDLPLEDGATRRPGRE
jgi:hypothetical protein